MKSFEPVALVSKVPLVMLVGPKVPAKSVKEFVAMAKGGKGEMVMSSSGSFSTGQLTGALFQNLTGTRLLHVPYKGGSLAMADLIGGHVDVMFDQINAATTHIRSGRVRALALTSASRSTDLPDVPTMAEAGVPGVESETFNALLAPAGTPRPIVTKLNDAVNKALAMKTVRDAYAKQGAEVLGGTPDAAGKYIRNEIVKWQTVVRTAGIKTEQQ